MASGLAQERHRVRRDLALPRDEHDYLAEVLRDEVLDAHGIELDFEGTAVLFWPRSEFDRLLLRWPVLAEEYGQTWEEYLTTVQQSLVLWSESGQPRLALFAGGTVPGSSSAASAYPGSTGTSMPSLATDQAVGLVQGDAAGSVFASPRSGSLSGRRRKSVGGRELDVTDLSAHCKRRWCRVHDAHNLFQDVQWWRALLWR